LQLDKGNTLNGKFVPKGSRIKFGGQTFAIPTGEFKGLFDEQAQKFTTQQRQQTLNDVKGTFNDLFGPEGPAFLKDMLANRPEQVRAAFAPAVASAAQGAVGAAAPRGTLTTDAVLNQAVAPVALQENQTNAQQLGLAGIPGFGPQFGIQSSAFTTPQSLGELQNAFLASRSLSQQAAIASGQSQQSADALKAGMLAGLGSSFSGLSGAAAGGAFGGGGQSPFLSESESFGNTGFGPPGFTI